MAFCTAAAAFRQFSEILAPEHIFVSVPLCTVWGYQFDIRSSVLCLVGRSLCWPFFQAPLFQGYYPRLSVSSLCQRFAVRYTCCYVSRDAVFSLCPGLLVCMFLRCCVSGSVSLSLYRLSHLLRSSPAPPSNLIPVDFVLVFLVCSVLHLVMFRTVRAKHNPRPTTLAVPIPVVTKQELSRSVTDNVPVHIDDPKKHTQFHTPSPSATYDFKHGFYL